MAKNSQSRSSSPASKRPSSSRRPKLMRASATAPSLATSKSSRDLASLSMQNSRAATLLERVASYSSAHCNSHREQRGGGYGGGYGHGQRGSIGSIGSVCSSPGAGRSSDSDGLSMERKGPVEVVISQCGNYYSFPSFEDFQDYQDSEERIDGRQDQGVP